MIRSIDYPQPRDVWKHYKGGVYRILTTAYHTETEQMMVVYHLAYGGGEVWVRPLDIFMGLAGADEHGNPRPRFELVPNFDEMNP